MASRWASKVFNSEDRPDFGFSRTCGKIRDIFEFSRTFLYFRGHPKNNPNPGGVFWAAEHPRTVFPRSSRTSYVFARTFTLFPRTSHVFPRTSTPFPRTSPCISEDILCISEDTRCKYFRWHPLYFWDILLNFRGYPRTAVFSRTSPVFPRTSRCINFRGHRCIFEDMYFRGHLLYFRGHPVVLIFEDIAVFPRTSECPRNSMSSEIQWNVLGNTEDVLENTAGCPRKYRECPRCPRKYREPECPRYPRKYSGKCPGAQRLRTHLLDSEISWGCPRNSVMSSKIQKCLVFFRMSSKIQNPICPRNYKLSMLILMSFFIERENLSWGLRTSSLGAIAENWFWTLKFTSVTDPLTLWRPH